MSDNFGRSDVSLCVWLTCKLYVVSIFLCNSSVEHGFCVLHAEASFQLDVCWVKTRLRGIGVDRAADLRRAEAASWALTADVAALVVSSLQAFPFPSCLLACGLRCTLFIQYGTGFWSIFIFRRVIAPTSRIRLRVTMHRRKRRREWAGVARVKSVCSVCYKGLIFITHK